MKYILAVSGGVDSMVLLDMFVKEGVHELIVAHFDHGIRENSAADARFVKASADNYGLAFESIREELGSNTNEEQARNRRYAFLQKLSKKYNAQVVTAHHKDDLIETIAINTLRGTGWRGLAVFGNTSIFRPLVQYRKQELYDYAVANQLEWVEDDTNREQKYLRNRIRRILGSRINHESITKLFHLWEYQNELRNKINFECLQLLENENKQSRYFFIMCGEQIAIELLSSLLTKDRLSLTRPQRLRLLYAIKSALPGSSFDAGDGITVSFTRTEFIVKNTSELLLL